MTAPQHGDAAKRSGPRHFRREASHHESHSRLADEQLAPIPAHPMICPDAPAIVETPAAMADMIAHLRQAGSFAFDSEFIGERSYLPRLCLVQVATTQKVFLLDPLCGLDLTEFWNLLTDADVEKIVLAGQSDLAPAVEHTGRPPRRIVDVQIAAGFIHADHPLSLGRLLQEFVGVCLGKALAFTHWDNRPLSAVQVRYAADDVRYLPAAWDVIKTRLTGLGRLAWAQEECAAALETIDAYTSAPELLYLRVRGRDRLGRRQLAVLRELAIFRDQAARQDDVPPRTLLKDGILATMARRPARQLADLKSIRGLPRPVEAKYGQQIVEATARAMLLSENQYPPANRDETAAAEERIARIWDEVTKFCQANSLAPSLAASRKEIARTVNACATGESLQEQRLLRGWRHEFLKDLLAGLGIGKA